VKTPNILRHISQAMGGYDHAACFEAQQAILEAGRD
jgi:hypothetical protein